MFSQKNERSYFADVVEEEFEVFCFSVLSKQVPTNNPTHGRGGAAQFVKKTRHCKMQNFRNSRQKAEQNRKCHFI